MELFQWYDTLVILELRCRYVNIEETKRRHDRKDVAILI